jgi:hypothetical protein
MAAVLKYGIPLVEDPARLVGVRELGVDETAFLSANGRHSTIFATGIVDLTGPFGPLYGRVDPQEVYAPKSKRGRDILRCRVRDAEMSSPRCGDTRFGMIVGVVLSRLGRDYETGKEAHATAVINSHLDAREHHPIPQRLRRRHKPRSIRRSRVERRGRSAL